MIYSYNAHEKISTHINNIHLENIRFGQGIRLSSLVDLLHSTFQIFMVYDLRIRFGMLSIGT